MGKMGPGRKGHKHKHQQTHLYQEGVVLWRAQRSTGLAEIRLLRSVRREHKHKHKSRRPPPPPSVLL